MQSRQLVPYAQYLDILRQVAAQMDNIVKKGVTSFKFFMAYKGALMVGDELLLDGMQRCKELGALAMVCVRAC